MAKNPDRVYKPRFGLYKKIQAYTQHPLYTPKTQSWFMCFFNESSERVEHTLNYLVFKRFLMRTPAGQYGVDLDMRKRFKGRFLEIRGCCFVKPDDHYAFVEVERKYTFGARHNDRVCVALNGYDEKGGLNMQGVVEEIIAPLSDRFCGRLEQDAQGFYVVPDDRDMERKVYLADQECNVPVGEYVYVEVVNGDALRKTAYDMAAPCQQFKSVSYYAFHEEWRDALEYVPEPRVCRIIMRASPDRAERFLLEKRFHDMYSPAAKYALENPPRRINYVRREFLNHGICRLQPDLAFHVEKTKNGARFYVHVPDLTDDIIPLEPLAKELCYKGCMEGLVPESIRETTAFVLHEKRRALSVCFTVDRLGMMTNISICRSRIVCQRKREPELYHAYAKHLPRDARAVHPVQKAAEVALAKLYGPKKASFPFDNFVYSRKMTDFKEFIEKADRFAEKKHIMECLDYYLVERVLMPKAAGPISSVPFGQPFSRFESILTQWCMNHYLYPHRNKDYEIEFAEFVKDETAVCMWQRTHFEEYRVLKRTEAWKKKHPTDDETLVTGIYIGEDKATPSAAHRFFVYSDKNIIFCEGVPEGTSAGTEVKFTVKTVHGGDVLLGSVRAVKEEN